MMALRSMKKMIMMPLAALLAVTGVNAESWDFENGFDGWTVIDANNDGYTWTLTSQVPTKWAFYANMSLDWYLSGSNAVCSGSYINGVGALSPDDYLVSPRVTPSTGSEIIFWAAAADATYSADHFGVAVSMTTPTKGAFTMLKEWTMNASRNYEGERQGAPRRIGSWHKYTVDLSSYAGRNIYVAIRHFNCSDQYVLIVDNVSVSEGTGDNNGKTVGIDNVNPDLDLYNHCCYDMQGRRILSPRSSQPSPLKKGIYIKDGKKVVVR